MNITVKLKYKKIFPTFSFFVPETIEYPNEKRPKTHYITP